MALQNIELVLDNTAPLKWPRGNHLPLYLWPVMDLETEDETEIEKVLRQLDQRGIGLASTWHPANYEQSLAQGLRVGRVQKQLGLSVGINANPCTYSFFNGDPLTAHVDQNEERFFDSSFGSGHQMGCPFAIDFRLPEMRKQVEDFVHAYQQSDVAINFVFADWEVDGPIEWNGAWKASKRCQRCCAEIGDIADFHAFQSALRQKRSQLQRVMLADSVTSYFPNALVGNYAVYPHDGYRYWYDYFEQFVEDSPHKREGSARYRQWFHEFPLTGYTCAMPVVYTWDTIWDWYDFDSSDYRWFYNMLKVGNNAAQSIQNTKSAAAPLVTFVHWHTVETLDTQPPGLQQFSADTYQELLWHLLLRGHETFFMWCPSDQIVQETQLVHQVYAASLEYRDFLDSGTPIIFDLSPQPGPVVSAIRLGNRLLVRRTDFNSQDQSLSLTADGKAFQVPPTGGQCLIIDLD